MELFTYLVVVLAPLTVYRQRCKSNLSGQLLIQDNTKSLRKTGGCLIPVCLIRHPPEILKNISPAVRADPCVCPYIT